MLKIKDNVKLSSLKKYGFHRDKNYYTYRIWDEVFTDLPDGDMDYINIKINCKTREIKFILIIDEKYYSDNYDTSGKEVNPNLLNPSCTINEYSLMCINEIMYDLIKANLVKKVDD